jgi:uncharacterized protein
MTLQTITNIFSGLFTSGWVGDELDVIWHAGEPLVLSTDYYTTAFREITRLTPTSTKVRHTFQTNGMLIDDDWCTFFKTHSATVGVSIDGPEDIHNTNRVTRSGKATHSSVIDGIRCLRRNDVEFSVITVLTKASLGKARELHEFYLAEGIKNVCFNVEEIEGTNTGSSLSGKDTKAEYENFMRQFWNLNVRSHGLYYVREFKDMLRKIVRPADDANIDNTLVEPFEHLSVDYKGNFSTFSPEFLGHTNEYYGNFVIGTFGQHSLAESLESEVFKRLSRDVSAGIQLCRSSCEYFGVCGGGSPVNKLYENGTIVSSETMYCRLSVKVIANLAMEIIENSAADEHGNRPAFVARPARDSYQDDDQRRDNQTLSWLEATDGAGGSRIVVVLSGEAANGVDRLEVNTGTAQPPISLGTWSYDDQAIVPNQRWRTLTADERNSVITSYLPQQFGMGIGVVRLPAILLEPFDSLRTAARELRKREEFGSLLSSLEIKEGTRAIARYIKAHFQPAQTDLEGEGRAEWHSVKPPGLPTVSVESNTSTLVGLHVDDWYSLPLSQRSASPNRISINLGFNDRFLLFLNLPLDQMYEEIRRSGRDVRTDRGGTLIARTFMTLFPSYPVLRLRIQQGEAYIAPTENIAHDASSLEMSTMDISLQIRGHFDLTDRLS